MATFQISGQVGPATAQDGAAPNIRQGRDGEIITADAIARFAEGTRRKKTFSGMTSAAGTTIVAANNTPIAAAAASIISLYNPIGSGVEAHLLRSWLEAISGTPAAGAFVYNVAFNQTITATQNNQGTAGLMPSCNYISGVTGACKVFVQTATTGSTLQALFKPIGASLFAAAIAATTAVNFEDKVDGDIVLPPGGLISIASPGTGTTVIVAAGFEWMEIGAQT